MQTNQTNPNEPTNESSQLGRVTPCAPSLSPGSESRVYAVGAPEHRTEPPEGGTPNGDTERRRFLKLAAAALLAGAALPQAAQAAVTMQNTGFKYTGGVVFNTELPGAAGKLILNVYLAVDPDGTGLGTLSDVLHPGVNSHLAITRTAKQGNQLRFEGVVLASNTMAREGRPFVVTSVVQQDFTALALVLDDGTFTGKGFHVWADVVKVGQ